MSVPARISIITLGIANLDRASAFYEALGWHRTKSSNEAICWFRTSGAYLGLFPYAELAKDANLPSAAGGPFGGITLAIIVESEAMVSEALQTAKNAGGAIIKPAERTSWGGFSGYFTDPDGHPWEVAYIPYFPLSKDGVLEIP